MSAPHDQAPERLQKVMAHAGIASRRKSEELIEAGRVRVNGEVVTELGTRVILGVDRIEVDGQPIGGPEALLYYVLYKPVGYLSTVSDPHGSRLAVDLVPDKGRLYPVGRLDKDSEGLLLFTNDGPLTHRLTHPRYEHEKVYYVLVDGALTPGQVRQMRQGIVIDESDRPAQAEVQVMPADWGWRDEPVPPGSSWVRITLQEGRKRQIRYMLQALGVSVRRLIRVRTGELTLGKLEPGEGRLLEEKEIRALRESAGLPPEGRTGRREDGR